MAFLEDVVDQITAQISHIGLSLDGSTEYAGAGYSHLAPSYGAAASGVADLSAALQFDGGANDGPVTHLIFKKDAGATVWTIRPVDTLLSFNSDGRLDLTTAPVTAGFAP